jgi:nitrogen fixation NifU-like protein
MDNLYREFLLDHYKNPKNKRKIEHADVHAQDSNPLCGDEVEIFMKLNNAHIKDVSFEGKGCVISMASASMLSEYVTDKNIADVKNMTREQWLEMINLPLTPTRIKCAMLPLATMKKGIMQYEET